MTPDSSAAHTRNHPPGCEDYAFGIMIDRHRDGAMRVAIRLLRTCADGEDVAQEALLHAFLDPEELRDRDRCVVNLGKSWQRLRREVPDAEPTPGEREAVED